MKYKHLFFDLDHTLWDFESNSRLTLQDIYLMLKLSERGVDDFERFHKIYLVHNEKLWDKYRKGFVKVEELRWKRKWLSLLDFRIGDEALAREMGHIFLELLPERKILFPHTIEILSYLLKKNYKLHLLTNGFEKTQHSKIRNSGIDHFFTEVITSENSNSLKPNKEIFEFALKKTGARPEESIMIGDSEEVDIKGAMDFGIDQVFVNYQNGPVNMNPTFIVHSLKELEAIF